MPAPNTPMVASGVVNLSSARATFTLHSDRSSSQDRSRMVIYGMKRKFTIKSTASTARAETSPGTWRLGTTGLRAK